MRTKKKLLPILITSLELGDKRDYYNNGICGEIHDLFNKGLASYDEITMILKFFMANKPTKNNKYNSFFNSPDFKDDSAWWWPLMINNPESREVRIKFLKELLINLK
jgi:hypothetical protein